MEPDLAKSVSQQHDRIDELRGEIHALKGALAVLIAHVALLTRAPHAKREESYATLNQCYPARWQKSSMMPHQRSAAGFERSIETLTHMARNAVRFDPVTPGQAGTPTAQDMPR